MKKILIGLFAVILVIFLLLAFLILWNRDYYCNPCNKEWHNRALIPSVSFPFREIYDGSYTIKIDRKGNVVFKPLDGEEIKGEITVTPNDKYTRANIRIDFEDGTMAEGYCYRDRDGRNLHFEYNSKYYNFSDEQSMSKEEFEEYRNGLIEFMYEIYEGGEFPTTQEVKENDLYKEYLDYYQIDSRHGGPIVYDVVTKATIESIVKSLSLRRNSLPLSSRSTFLFPKKSQLVSLHPDLRLLLPRLSRDLCFSEQWQV